MSKFVTNKTALGIDYLVTLDADDGHERVVDIYEATQQTAHGQVQVLIEDYGHTVLLAVAGPQVVPTLHRFVNTVSAMRAAALAVSA